MVQLSLIIPQRDAGDVLPAQLAQVQSVLAEHWQSFEILVVDDGSGPATVRKLFGLLARYPALRVIRSPRRDGLSAALAAGFASATGEVVVTMEAGPRFAAQQIPTLVDHLVRADLAFGRPLRQGWAKAWRRVGRIPRWLLLGLDVRDPECLFWAARREAVSGLELGRGMYRYLATLVGMRGYRVCEVQVETHAPQRPTHDGWPNPGDLLATWWLRRRCHLPASQRLAMAEESRSVDDWGTLSDVPRDVIDRAA